MQRLSNTCLAEVTRLSFVRTKSVAGLDVISDGCFFTATDVFCATKQKFNQSNLNCAQLKKEEFPSLNEPA